MTTFGYMYRRVSNLSNACRSFITPSAPIKRAHTANKTIAQPRARARLEGTIANLRAVVEPPRAAMSAPRVGRCVSPRRPAGRSRPALPAASATPGRAASCRPARASAARRASSAPGSGSGWLCGWRQCTQTSVNNRNNNKIRIFSMKVLHAPDQTTAHVANKTPERVA